MEIYRTVAEVVITLKKMYKTAWFIILEHAQSRQRLETRLSILLLL